MERGEGTAVVRGDTLAKAVVAVVAVVPVAGRRWRR